MPLPIIMIVIDQLTSLKYINPEVLNELNGIKKFKSKSIYFENYYTNSVPCSAARSVLYTGQHTNKTKITENIEIQWQKTLTTPANGLKTLATYIKEENSNIETRYIGKTHLLKNLVVNDFVKNKPKLATENAIKNYSFDKSDKFGDNCFDTRCGFFNDNMVTQNALPVGTISTTADYYDSVNNISFDGLIPFLQSQNSSKPFLVCANYDNPHDILYTNIATDIQNLQSISIQIDGFNRKFQLDNNIQSVSNHNENFRLYSNIDLFTKKSVQLDNNMGSIINNDISSIGIIFQLISKYYYFGNDYFNIEQFQQYQTAYYRCLKHVDNELEKIYDYLEVNGFFTNSIICLTSDHGDYVGAHGILQKGASIYNGGFNVPTFISYPNIPIHLMNTTSSIIVSHINLVPTLLTLGGYSNAILNNPQLSSSFFDSNNNIIEKDYYIVKLCLSINFGAFLYNILNSLNNFEINYILDNKLANKNYLTIDCFSVSTIINYNNSIYNCGYYFSLLNVFVQTINNIRSQPILLNDLFNALLSILNSFEQFILYDPDVNFAFVGNSVMIHFQTFTSPIIKKYFKNYKINIFNPLTNKYNYNLGYSPFYNTTILSTNDISINNIFNLPILNNLNSNLELYMIISDNIRYVGNFDDLSLLLKFDSIILNLIKKPIIIQFSNDNIFFTNSINHPTLDSVIIEFNNLYNNLIINNYSNYNILLMDNIKMSVNISINKLSSIIFKHNFIDWMIYNIITYANNNNILYLPGLSMNLQELTAQNIQIMIFDLTNDPDELVNIADSSRYKNNYVLIDKLINKLYQNILFNDLERIFISLPTNYIFTNGELKNIIKNNMEL